MTMFRIFRSDDDLSNIYEDTTVDIIEYCNKTFGTNFCDVDKAIHYIQNVEMCKVIVED